MVIYILIIIHRYVASLFKTWTRSRINRKLIRLLQIEIFRDVLMDEFIRVAASFVVYTICYFIRRIITRIITRILLYTSRVGIIKDDKMFYNNSFDTLIFLKGILKRNSRDKCRQLQVKY